MTNYDLSTIHERPVELLQRLIRFDTTNPPGNEVECIRFIDEVLKSSGFDTRVLGRTPERANLVTRLPGQGKAPPLLLYGHVDVVTTEKQAWSHPPFAAEIADGWLWGRGALDMKGGIAMMLAAILRARAEGLRPPGDVIFAAMADEEVGGNFGAQFLVEEHPYLFEGVRYALSEFGGFTQEIGGRKYIPIMVAEKQVCWMKATLRGTGGHASMPVQGGAMAKLAQALRRLDRHPLPVHITPAARAMFGGMARGASGAMKIVFSQLLNPALSGAFLKLLGEHSRALAPLLRNTVSPTIVRASDKVNVIPALVELELDGRLLPGIKPGEMLAEVRRVIGQDVELEILRHDPGPGEPDMGLFDILAGILKERVPDGVPIPLLLSGVTDARFMSLLGIQTYGFLPMQLPRDMNLGSAAHAADERIPVESIAYGADAIYRALQLFG